MSTDVGRRSWRAMGCAVDAVIVGGAPHLIDVAHRSIDHLEQRWSRFLPDSDISRINHSGGSSVRVDPATIVLLQAMVEGWRATGGVFDPTLLAPLVGLGYSSSWHDPAAETSLPLGALLRGDLGAVQIDCATSTVTVPPGMCLDAGGIGKGLAADLVVDQLLRSGARGALLSIGGDICARGEAPDPDGWVISVGDAFDFDRPAGRLLLVAGGVATSGTIRRSWRTADGEHHHHLLDPMTGRPAQHTRQIVSATVVAGSAAWAEVWTKALAVRGEAVLGTLDGHGLAASMTDDDGSVVTNEAWRSFDCSPAARVA